VMCGMGFCLGDPTLRRPPFDDVDCLRPLMLAINGNLTAQAAWNGYAVPANSHVSAALPFWHKGEDFKPNIEEAKRILEKSGYKLIGGKLHYPDGKRETLTSLN